MSTEWHFITDRCESAFHCLDAIERPTGSTEPDRLPSATLNAECSDVMDRLLWEVCGLNKYLKVTGP